MKKLLLSLVAGVLSTGVSYAHSGILNAASMLQPNNSQNITVDDDPPQLTISSPSSNPTNAYSFEVTFTFTEAVTGFDINDVDVNNGYAYGFSGIGSQYTVTVGTFYNASLTVDVNSGAATDADGNLSLPAAQFSRIVDQTSPYVSISTYPNPTNSTYIHLNIYFSESVTGFTPEDLNVTNATVISLYGDNSLYFAMLIPVENSIITVSLGSNAVSDAAGNGNTAADQLNIVHDNIAPSVTILSNVEGSTNATNVPLDIYFSEPVTGFDISDIIVSNGSLSGFSGSGDAYSVILSPDADGAVSVNIGGQIASDTAGNQNTAAAAVNFVSDRTAPYLNIISSEMFLSNAATIPLIFIFSEDITSFEPSYIYATNGVLSNFTGGGSVYTATLTPEADGYVSVFSSYGAGRDAASNSSGVAMFFIESDRSRPTVVISSPETSPTSASPFVVNINFSESVYWFDASDVSLLGGTLSNFTGSGSSYSFDFSPVGTGNKRVNIAANVANDHANNQNLAATQYSIFYITPCSLTTTWNGFFWTNGDPVATQPAVIAADYTATTDLSACQLIVGNNSHVIVLPGVDFTIKGNVTVQSGSSLTFENNANLVQTNVTTNNSGNIISKRDTGMRRLDYTFWSSPVAGQNLLLFSEHTIPDRFYTLNEAANSFAGIDPATSSFQTGRGYMIRAPNTFPPGNPGPVTTFNGRFNGVPNSGSYTVNATNTPETGSGFNLLGNPYPSPVDAFVFLTENPGTLYFWTHADQTTTGGSNYAVYNKTGSSNGNDELPNGLIQTGQGFLYHTTADRIVNFNNAMRMGDNQGQFYRTHSGDKHRIWLDLAANGTVLNEILIGYLPEATMAFDESFDGKQNFDGSSLSSLIGTDAYAIQARSLPFADTDIVPLRFKALTAAQYEISLSSRDGIFTEEQAVLLHDSELGITHAFANGAYSFMSAAGTFNNRFSVVYQNVTLGVDNPEAESNRVVVYNTNTGLNINSGDLMMSAVDVYDVRGSLIYTQQADNVNQLQLNGLQASGQLLILKIKTTDNKSIVKKAAY